MDVAPVIFFLGILIFLGNILSRLFTLTRIPDLIFLIAIGLVIGPATGLVSPGSFGIVGPIFATITLAVILFEGGLHLRVETIHTAFGGTIALTLSTFIVTMAFSSVVLYFGGFLSLLPALMLGAILGGASPAVVIPMIKFLHLEKDSGAILSLESAIADVLCIVVFITIFDAYQLGTPDPRIVAGRLIAAIVLAVIFGVLAGVFWSAMHHRMGDIGCIFLTPAVLFILYGFVDMVGYSGAIAALAFGITLGNLDSFNISRFFPSAPVVHQLDLNPTEQLFLGQLVQLLKTFFFIYIGLSIRFASWESFVIGGVIVLALFFMRIVLVLVSVPRTIPAWDAGIIAIMIPKGLAAAVLAGIPLQAGLAEGLFIETTTFSVILFSIVLSSVLVILLERTRFRKIFAGIFRQFGQAPVPSAGQEQQDSPACPVQ